MTRPNWRYRRGPPRRTVREASIKCSRHFATRFRKFIRLRSAPCASRSISLAIGASVNANELNSNRYRSTLRSPA